MLKLTEGKSEPTLAKVIDVDGISLSNMGKQCYSFLQSTTAIQQDHYPSMLGNCIIIEAPFIFYSIWAIIKYFLNENTLKKIKIV